MNAIITYSPAATTTPPASIENVTTTAAVAI